MANIPIIAFGPNSMTYFIGLGTRYHSVGMPPSIANTVKKWPATQMMWMSIEADGSWIVKDSFSGGVEFDTRLTPQVVEKFRNAPHAEYVAFGPKKGTYAVILPGGTWTGFMENAHLDHLRVIQASVGGAAGFDRALTGILFGKGSTMVFMFHGGFSYYTAEEADGGRLEKLLNQYVYRQPPWTIDRGSSLCPWNVDYFFIKFKHSQTGQIESHWSLPPNMHAHMVDLQRLFQAPEAQAAVAQQNQAGWNQAVGNAQLAFHLNHLMFGNPRSF